MQQGPTAHLSASGIKTNLNAARTDGTPECTAAEQHTCLQVCSCRRVSAGGYQEGICRGVSAGGYLQAGLACSAGAQVHLPQSAGCHNCCSRPLQQPEHPGWVDAAEASPELCTHTSASVHTACVGHSPACMPCPPYAPLLQHPAPCTHALASQP